ncbi:MAG: MarR family winged helix-turn-helix transcriptional regulator [Panacagrimonas sp.]
MTTRSTAAGSDPTSGQETPRISDSAKEFLDLFYPVHYKIGIGIEDALRGGRLTRHQVAILWLVRSEGEGGRSIPRKQIERSMTRWFELRNSAISKSLRAMARAPLGLLEIREHPSSGRERQVVLTAKGAREIERMVDQGRRFIQTMVDRLSTPEAAQGVHFLTRVSSIIELVDPPKRSMVSKTAQKTTGKK